MLVVRMISIFICSHIIVYGLMHICILNNVINKKTRSVFPGYGNYGTASQSVLFARLESLCPSLVYYTEKDSLQTSILVPKCSWQRHFSVSAGCAEKAYLSAFRAWILRKEAEFLSREIETG